MLRSLAVLLAASPVLLSGCALQTTATSTPELQHLVLTGSVHGGQQPVVGAHVSVLQGSAGAVGSASYDLLANYHGEANGVTVGTPDHVTTDANGAFSITGDYACKGGGPVYLLATQGNPGLGAGKNNPALAELAVVATDCTSTLPATLQIGITEETTVAGVYSLAGFMTSPLAASSSGTPLAITGFENAGATAMGLVNLATGIVLPTTAAGATIPVAKINLLADIIAGCINSDGTGTACSSLFSNARNGSTTPTDTVTALLNIAHNPTASITGLFRLATASGPYQPVTTVQPTDLTLALTYPTITDMYGDTVSPNLPSISAAGSVVLSGEDYYKQITQDVDGSLTVLSNRGSIIFSDYLLQYGNGVAEPQAVTIDPSGNAWLANGALTSTFGGQLVKVNLATGASTSYGGHNQSSITQSIVSDASGNIFTADNSSADAVYEYDNNGAYQRTLLYGCSWTGLALVGSDLLGGCTASNIIEATNTASFGPVNNPYPTIAPANSLAADSSGRLWTTAGNGNALYVYTVQNVNSTGPSQVTVVQSATYSGGGLSFNYAAQPLVPVVMDGASSAWVPNYAGNSISGFTNAGAALTPAAAGSSSGGFQTGCPSKGVAVDGSGNIWVTCDIGSSLTGTPLVEFIGTAVPVATPILPGQAGVRP